MTTVSTVGPRTGRGTELLLLAFACAIVLLAYVNLGLVTSGEVPANLVAHAIGLCAMALAFHLVIRWRAPYADPLMLPIATLLNGLESDDKQVGIETMCVAGGQGVATIVERLN